jgi:MSHA type pilus biogenesis protein MshL
MSLTRGGGARAGGTGTARKYDLRSFGARTVFAGIVCMGFAGCEHVRPYVPPSEGHIALPQPAPAPEPVIPPPARISNFVPPPQPAVKPHTYSVVVNEVPVKELLNALARDTKQNIDIHPQLQGLVSLNAIDETLPSILERISRQVNMRFRQEAGTIIVTPDTPYMKTYRVNYVNVTRNVSSTVNVTGEVGNGSSGSASGAHGASGGGGNSPATGTGGSRTTVTSTTSNDFWEQLRDNIRAILISTGRIAASADERARVAEESRAAREEALKRAEAVARAGPGAAELMRNAFPPLSRTGTVLPQSDTGTDVIMNPISGTISVLATDRQQHLVQQHLDNVTNAVQRQVLIEATIVEVRLADAYQAGVDLQKLATNGGFAIASLMGAGAGFTAAATAAGAVTGGLTITRSPATGSSSNITATIRLLQEFGNTRVLSSPKVMAINNQTALLKHVDNLVYFEVQAQPGVVSNGVVAPTTFSTIAKTVSVGVVLGVTPQINEDGRVTLTVRPTVSRLLGPGKQDPNPNLCGISGAGGCLTNIVPEIQIRELESVLQVASGQTIVLGGLMEDDASFNREQIPVAANVPLAGELFRFRNERVQKRELIIFVRPTVLTNPSIESDELKFFQRFLPQAAASSTEVRKPQ